MTPRRARGRRRRTGFGVLDRLQALAALGGVTVMVASLHHLGPPPRVRVDLFWVHWNWPTIQLSGIGLAVALAAAVLGLVRAKGWLIPLLLLAAACWACFQLFSDRVPLVLRTVAGHIQG